MEGAGTHFEIQWRGQHTTASGPVVIQRANEILKIHGFEPKKCEAASIPFGARRGQQARAAVADEQKSISISICNRFNIDEKA